MGQLETRLNRLFCAEAVGADPLRPGRRFWMLSNLSFVQILRKRAHERDDLGLQLPDGSQVRTEPARSMNDEIKSFSANLIKPSFLIVVPDHTDLMQVGPPKVLSETITQIAQIEICLGVVHIGA